MRGDTSSAVLELARSSSRQLVMDRGMDAEAHVLEVIHGLLGASTSSLSLRAITTSFLARFGSEYEGRVTTRWLGRIMRSRLQLRPQKSHGIYVLAPGEFPKLRRLFERYGIGEAEPAIEPSAVDGVEVGDSDRGP